MDNVKILRNWSIGCDTSRPDFRSPEQGPRHLAGTLPCGKVITTSHVAERVAPATYRTRSGSLYKLEGPPQPEYAAWCKEHGFELDPDDPLKIIRSSPPALTRLQEAVQGKPLPRAADAVVALHKIIWKECLEKDPEAPGGIYGEALKEAGFRVGQGGYDGDDRHRMASFPVSASADIARRELGLLAGRN